jgi:hypothetical protein
LIKGHSLAEKRREFIDNLFNYALVLLGILSAAELQYAARALQNASDFDLVFRVSVLPFVVLIPIWLIKELLKEEVSRRQSMFLTEFCWEFWSFTLFGCLVLLYAIQTSNLTFIVYGALTSLILSIFFNYALTRAYAHTYRNGPYQDMVEFYQRRRFRAFRSAIFLIAYFMVYLILL